VRRAVKRIVSAPLAHSTDYLTKAVMARHGGHEPPDRRQVYTALAALEARYGWRQTALGAAEMRVFSQNGEDGVLAEIFARLGTTNRYFVEFGIESGAEGNAVLLADALDWQGLFLEGDQAFFERLAAKYANNPRVATVRAFVTAANFDALLTAAGVPTAPDLLSIDVDGNDYFLWESLQAFRPRVVVVEYNSSLAADESLVVKADAQGRRVWDGTSYYGCSLGALVDLAARKGYRLAHCEMTGNNAFFVCEEEWGKVGVETVTFRSANHYLAGGTHPADALARSYQRLES
jgi:hypothetical protein